MKIKWIQSFIYSACAILLFAALFRFAIFAGGAQALSLPEPLLGIPLRYAVLLVGVIELIVALLCLYAKRVGFQIGLLTWLATNFLIYWVVLLSMHFHPQSTCLGSLTDPLHLTRGFTGCVMPLMPFYLLISSYAAAIWLCCTKEGTALRENLGLASVSSPQTRHPVPHNTVKAGQLCFESFKINCPCCDGHIAFDSEYLGLTIPCPHCQASIFLQKPGLVRTEV